MQETTVVGDSAELAALRKAVEAGWHPQGAAEKLLLMVDELTTQVRYLMVRRRHVVAERDQLRGALQSAVACEAGWIAGARKLEAENVALSEKLAEASGLIGELREKLAEGERMLRAENADMRLHMRRAEAAEARVRKLTDALFAATGGHVDLDRLVP